MPNALIKHTAERMPSEEYNPEILADGDALRLARESEGTQEWLEKKTKENGSKGVALRTIKRIEAAGKRGLRVRTSTLDALARALGRNLRELTRSGDEEGIEIGGASQPNELLLTIPSPPSDPNANETLRPEMGIALVGSGRMGYLNAFMERAEPFLISVIYGPGGVGKTRLTLEAAKHWASKGWHAGFLQLNAMSRFLGTPWFDTWMPKSDTLVIIDYPLHEIRDVTQYVDRFARLKNGKKLRLVLLERYAHKEQGWLNDFLNSFEKSMSTIERLLDLHSLPPLAFQSAKGSQHAEALTLLFKCSRLRPCPISPEDLKRIEDITEGRPLHLQILGSEIAERGWSKALKMNTSKLLSKCADREIQYIKRSCPNSTLSKAVVHAVAILCLTGVERARKPDWNLFLKNELDLIGAGTLSAHEVNERVQAIYGPFTGPRNGRFIIQPDAVAAAFAALVFGSDRKVHTRIFAASKKGGRN